MKKNLNRLLSLLLCLLLSLSVLPTAYAAGGVDELLVEDEEIVVASSAVSNAKPKISSSPSAQTAAKGSTAKFTVKATGKNLKYQWYYRTSSSGSWKKATATGSKTATLKVSATAKRSGYEYRCKVSNGSGHVYSKAAKLTVVSSLKITSQPASKTVKQGNTTKFTVKTNCTGLSYQWYYRTSSSGSWKKATGTGNKTATLKLTATAKRDGYQYRCKISNGSKTVYTKAVTLTVNKVEYRALLVGEIHFSWETANRNRGDVQRMSRMLNSVKGGKGNEYDVTCKYDLTHDEILSAVNSTFKGADSNDVSLFFIATHGAVDVPYGYAAGAMVTIESPGYYDGYLYMEELADALSKVPGKVIVLLGSCGSGAAIVDNGRAAAKDSIRRFNEAAVKAFAAKNSFVPDEEGDVAVSNTGEFRNSKFYVLTAAAHQESSWGQEAPEYYTDFQEYSYNSFPYWLSYGGTGPADGNGNGSITLTEMYRYLQDNASGPFYDGYDYYYQHVQVYPEGSTYVLFKY